MHYNSKISKTNYPVKSFSNITSYVLCFYRVVETSYYFIFGYFTDFKSVLFFLQEKQQSQRK